MESAKRRQSTTRNEKSLRMWISFSTGMAFHTKAVVTLRKLIPGTKKTKTMRTPPRSWNSTTHECPMRRTSVQASWLCPQNDNADLGSDTLVTTSRAPIFWIVPKTCYQRASRSAELSLRLPIQKGGRILTSCTHSGQLSFR